LPPSRPPPGAGEVLWSGFPGRRSRPSPALLCRMTNCVNINDVLDGHVALEVDCVDRLYLNAYVPNLRCLDMWGQAAISEWWTATS
jgi:hypothetical protein